MGRGGSERTKKGWKWDIKIEAGDEWMALIQTLVGRGRRKKKKGVKKSQAF